MGRASDLAYDSLRSDILDWSIGPGTVLQEVELSSRFGISRTPVREALARLVADGLAEPLGGRGLVVSQVSAENVVELFELRQALEVQAAALAAERRDVAVFEPLQAEFQRVARALDEADPDRRGYYDLVARFDEAVDAAVANPYLAQALSNVRTHLARIRRLSHDNPDRLLAAAGEHLLILDAIVAGDVRLASDATRVHLHRSLQWILRSASVPHRSIDRAS
jgi:DNA-binding GntR family transcriptional regulator